MATQILVHQLTPSQPERTDYAHHITITPPPRIFIPSYGPVSIR
jgi:hypothetical protein